MLQKARKLPFKNFIYFNLCFECRATLESNISLALIPVISITYISPELSYPLLSNRVREESLEGPHIMHRPTIGPSLLLVQDRMSLYEQTMNTSRYAARLRTGTIRSPPGRSTSPTWKLNAMSCVKNNRASGFSQNWQSSHI